MSQLQRRTRIYVSGPLTTSGVPEEHVRTAADLGYQLQLAGYAPYIPHLTWFLLELNPGYEHFSHAVWMEVDVAWVGASDAVLRFPGESVGADIEVDYAVRAGIPVCYSLEDLFGRVPPWRPVLSGDSHGSTFQTGNAPGS